MYKIRCDFLFTSEINECESQPCKNGGTCKEEDEKPLLRASFEKDVESFYTCVCKPGYTGKNCEIGKNELKGLNMTLTKTP